MIGFVGPAMADLPIPQPTDQIGNRARETRSPFANQSTIPAFGRTAVPSIALVVQAALS
jgi:hypothetical protein